MLSLSFGFSLSYRQGDERLAELLQVRRLTPNRPD